MHVLARANLTCRFAVAVRACMHVPRCLAPCLMCRCRMILPPAVPQVARLDLFEPVTLAPGSTYMISMAAKGSDSFVGELCTRQQSIHSRSRALGCPVLVWQRGLGDCLLSSRWTKAGRMGIWMQAKESAELGD